MSDNEELTNEERMAKAASLLEPYTHDLDTFGTITMNVLRRAIALLTE